MCLHARRSLPHVSWPQASPPTPWPETPPALKPSLQMNTQESPPRRSAAAATASRCVGQIDVDTPWAASFRAVNVTEVYTCIRNAQQRVRLCFLQIGCSTPSFLPFSISICDGGLEAGVFFAVLLRELPHVIALHPTVIREGLVSFGTLRPEVLHPPSHPIYLR